MSVDVSAMLLEPSPCGVDDGWAADCPEPLASALQQTLPTLRAHPDAARECAQVLAELDKLHCDSDTRAACLRFLAWQTQAAADELPEWPPELTDSETRLLDGQAAARQVWALHARREPGSIVEGLRRLLLSIIGDIRVVFILLADQLVRLRGAADLPDDERLALARLTADIHAPLANRLGVWQLKWELEDLAFRHLQPATYQRVARLLAERRDDREQFISHCIAVLSRQMAEAGIEADIAGRPKHIYSIWRKMQRKGLQFTDLYDIRAVRIIVDDVPACYAALGIVHGLWPYIPDEFDDYIAHPKGNDYKSLHTAVHGPDGKVLEVQIRTHAMHEANELGVAAHWRYKEGGGRGDKGFDQRLSWLRRLLDERGEDEGDVGLLDDLRGELLQDRVYLLSPQGDVYDLPAGATVLDFAYYVHSEVGNRCRGAKVNGRIVPLTHQPRSGDRIEVLTASNARPSRDWLSTTGGMLNAPRARRKVRAWFRRNDRDANLEAGQAMYERELKRLGVADVGIDTLLAPLKMQTRQEFLVSLALGELKPGQLARALEHHLEPQPSPLPGPPPSAPADGGEEQPGGLRIAGVGNLLSHLAHCCQPLPGDAVCGFITRGHGVSVHRSDCEALARLRQRDADRVIDVAWGDAPERVYRVNIEVSGYDRKGLQKDVTTVISNADVRIVASSSRMVGDTAEVRMCFTVKVGDFGELSALLARIDGLANVIDARRLHEK